jgi:hypothetical protein
MYLQIVFKVNWTRQELSVSDTKDSECIPGRYGVITIRPAGGQPPAGLLAARGLAARRA